MLALVFGAQFFSVAPARAEDCPQGQEEVIDLTVEGGVRCQPIANPNPQQTGDTNNPTSTNNTTTTTNNGTNSQQPLNSSDPNCLVDNRGGGALSGQTTKICNPLGKTNMVELVLLVLNKIFAAIGVVAAVVLVFAGFKLVLMASNEKEYSNAKNTVTNAMFGLALALLAYIIVAVVQNIITR